MTDEKKDKSEPGGVYKIETVPPPAGEDDAYSAPTKVGPMGDAFVKNLMKDAEQRSAELARKEKDAKAKADGPPPSKAPAKSGPVSAPPASAPVSAGGTALPKIYDDEDDDGATVLSPKAKPPAMPQRPSPLHVTNDDAAPALANAFPPAEGGPAPNPAPPPATPAGVAPAMPPPPWESQNPQGPIPFDPTPPAAARPPLGLAAVLVAVAGLSIFLVGLVMWFLSRR